MQPTTVYDKCTCHLHFGTVYIPAQNLAWHNLLFVCLFALCNPLDDKNYLCYGIESNNRMTTKVHQILKTA